MNSRTKGRDSTRARRRAAMLSFVPTVAFVCMTAGVARSQEKLGEEIDATRTALEKWVETRRIISQEKREWAMGREMLNDRIALLQREIQSLRERIAEAENNISEADQSKQELIEEKANLEAASAGLADAIGPLESRAVALLQRMPDPLPDPLRERVERLSQRIPDEGESTELSLGERFQNIVGILNEVNKFHGVVTATSEVRTLSDGRAAEVAAIYIGLGQAYYVTTAQDAAGIGTYTKDGWVWTPADEHAEDIARAIAVLKNEVAADFVRLPVRIQ